MTELSIGTKSADTSGVRIEFDDAGTGRPALLGLPGWCGGRELFAPVGRDLARHHRFLSLDWRGHGGSDRATGDVGLEELVSDAEAVIRASGEPAVIPVAVSHAGWVALELRRRLGRRIPAVVLVDWIVLDPPAPFRGALVGLQDPASWRDVREALFAMWLGGSPPAVVESYVRENMGSYGPETWSQASRMIGAAYDREGTPLRAFAGLAEPPPVMHLYAQPRDEGYLAAQQDFARAHPWFRVRRLDAATHFPTLEAPKATADAIAAFVAGIGAPAADPLQRAD